MLKAVLLIFLVVIFAIINFVAVYLSGTRTQETSSSIAVVDGTWSIQHACFENLMLVSINQAAWIYKRDPNGKLIPCGEAHD